MLKKTGELDPPSVTDQLIASLWASALSDTVSSTYTDTQIHLCYYPMGKSWIRLPLRVYPHTYTQTHPSNYYRALLEAPQILICSDFWVALDKGSTLNPMLSSLSPFPPPPNSSAPLPSFPTASSLPLLLPRACLITVSVCARWALSKQILPPACFVCCGGGRRRGRQRRPGIRLLFSPAE